MVVVQGRGATSTSRGADHRRPGALTPKHAPGPPHPQHALGTPGARGRVAQPPPSSFGSAGGPAGSCGSSSERAASSGAASSSSSSSAAGGSSSVRATALAAAAFAARGGALRPGNVAARAAAAAGGAAAADGGGGAASTGGLGAFLSAFWKFLRPHTIRGTVLGTTAVVTRALLDNPAAIDGGLLPRALLGLLALLCGNGYIVGINQIYDVEIDALNKPFLPVAAGELSAPAAWALCGGLAALGLAVTAANFGPLISGLYAFGLFLGTIYSVPPLRLKQYAIPAFMIIATVRGFLLNFGVYHAARAALQLPFVWSPPIA
jgi:hypothetical protein